MITGIWISPTGDALAVQLDREEVVTVWQFAYNPAFVTTEFVSCLPADWVTVHPKLGDPVG